MASSNVSNGSLDRAGRVLSTMMMLPHYLNATTGVPTCFLFLLTYGGHLYRNVNSHTEWVQKTTPARANRVIFWFD